MNRDEAITKMASDIAENTDIDSLVMFMKETIELDFQGQNDEDLYDEWALRFDAEPNPFQEG